MVRLNQSLLKSYLLPIFILLQPINVCMASSSKGNDRFTEEQAETKPNTRAPIKTQVNEVDNRLFDGTGSRAQIEAEMKAGIEASTNIFTEDNTTLKQGIKEQGIDVEGAKATAQELKSLDAHELEGKAFTSKGYNKIHGRGYFIDGKAPGMPAHKRDVEVIAQASSKLMDNLMFKLKENGLDCKEVPAERHIDPAWHLRIEQEKIEDRVYDKFMCESLRNTYNCSDNLSTRCTKKNRKLGEWQTKNKSFSGEWIYKNHSDWLYSYYRDMSNGSENSRRDDLSLYYIDRAKQHSISQYLRGEIGGNIETLEILNIAEPNLNADWVGEDSSNKSRLYSRYDLTYRYREFGPEYCEAWEESWNEACTQK